MKLYLDELLAGIQETVALYKQGESIFEMGGGNMFPNIERQQMWQWSKAPGHIHFTDGMKTYSFKHQGELADEDLEMEKIPDVPLPDLFKDSTSKGKAQVHRADPGSIYFTLQEGTRNPTYTFRHVGGQKWKAVVKKKKAKQALKEPAYIENVNAEAVKQGMLKAAEELSKEGSGGLLGFFNQAGGKALDTAVNAPFNIGMLPGRVGGAVSPMESGWNTAGNALGAAGIGAGLGAAYHGFKRHFVNSKEENEQESPMAAVRRIALPALATGGLNLAQRSLFPNYFNMAAEGKTPQMTAGPD